MKKLKVIIQLEMKGDENDEETLKEDIYQYLQELIDEDSLEFEVVEDEEEEEDY
jgi:hypothetical protein